MRAPLTFVLVLTLAAVLSAQQKNTADDRAPRPKTVTPASLVPPGAPAPGPADAAKIADVLAFEKQMEAAVVRGDVAALAPMLSEDFLFTHGDGWTDGGAPLKVDSKASWLEYVKKQPLPYVYRELDSVQVELHGDIALTIGRYYYLPRTNAPTPPTGHLYVWFERVYQKQNGQWKHLSHRTVKGPVRENDATPVASAR